MRRRTALLLWLFGIQGATAEASTVESIQPKPSQIVTTTVSKQDYDYRITLDAKLEPVKAATVSAQTHGRILKLNYDINDRVTEGSALLEITATEQSAQVANASAQLAKTNAVNRQAQLQLQRYQELFPQGAISQGAMDDAIANAKSSEQAVKAAQAQLVHAQASENYTIVTAPFSGIVTKRHVEVGETVNSGQALMSGYATNQLRAVTHVPQKHIQALKEHPSMLLELANGEQLSTRDITIFEFADPHTLSYQVRIKIPANQSGVSPGQWAKASFIHGRYQSIYIPKSALVYANEVSGVYLQLNGKFVLSQIRIGRHLNDQVEVLSGLVDGDVIASNAYDALLHPQYADTKE
ncbi:efflux RND transporter periplasmic adaptor subunit [Shewanella gelidii]|uniref:Hemolysin D n=1 Tax=Shewanella gelidii TaxID=1642821 RepID=A0A917JUX3_9GAMM|nr:efflux RND transporter periplasmic adaptor subunit [Shewanella gelidii]MCL1098211.1 efflux RND transporter periplasmic adaptor subunit [Shewanella gelidii]GGI83431.1 hemolysin D [Shewanella gelidii]